MRHLAWLSALIVLIALGAAAYGQALPEPRTLKINERVYVLLGPVQHANRFNQGYMINSTVTVGDKGVILVDSGGSDEVGRHIAAAVRRITDKPVTHVVNTHHHGDHYLGNTAFEGATFISSEMCRRTGDVLVSRIVPTLQDGFVKNWIQTLGEVQALGVAHFVPGHGDLMTRDDVTALRDAMLRFYSGVREGFRRGQSEGEIRKSLDLSTWNKLERSYVIGRNINRAYLEIEADSFDE